MRILVAGAWLWHWYEAALADAWRGLGHEVIGHGWSSYFRNKLVSASPTFKSAYHRVEHRLGVGPVTYAYNRDLVARAISFSPDVVFVNNGTLVLPSTLRAIGRKLRRTLLVQYCNDNPFSDNADWLLWRHVRRSVPLYDVHFAYRHNNIADLESLGGREVSLLRSYYVPEEDYRQEPEARHEHLRCDVLFAGHYEPDGRFDALEQLAALPLKLNLFGGGWGAARSRLTESSPLRRFFPVSPVVGEEYRKAISGAKIALCFLSKLNFDTYTRRNFQIPAMGTFMLSEYTSDLASMYEEGRDAEFFRSPDEMLDKIRYYLAHDAQRERIAANGYRRLVADGHDVTARARQVLTTAERLMRR